MFITHLAAAAVAAAVAASAPAPAPTLQPVSLVKGASVARLATPLTRGSDPVLDGRIWHCEGAVCHAGAMASARVQSTQRECAAAARKLGAFESYQTGGELLAGDDLAKCNAVAKR